MFWFLNWADVIQKCSAENVIFIIIQYESLYIIFLFWKV